MVTNLKPSDFSFSVILYNIRLGGEIKVLQSDFYLPAIFNEGESGNENEDIPLLVAALSERKDSVIIVEQLDLASDKETKKQSEILKNLTGKLRIDIPNRKFHQGYEFHFTRNGKKEFVDMHQFTPDIPIVATIRVKFFADTTYFDAFVVK